MSEHKRKCLTFVKLLALEVSDRFTVFMEECRKREVSPVEMAEEELGPHVSNIFGTADRAASSDTICIKCAYRLYRKSGGGLRRRCGF